MVFVILACFPLLVLKPASSLRICLPHISTRPRGHRLSATDVGVCLKRDPSVHPWYVDSEAHQKHLYTSGPGDVKTSPQSCRGHVSHPSTILPNAEMREMGAGGKQDLSPGCRSLGIPGAALVVPELFAAILCNLLCLSHNYYYYFFFASAKCLSLAMERALTTSSAGWRGL